MKQGAFYGEAVNRLQCHDDKSVESWLWHMVSCCVSSKLPYVQKFMMIYDYHNRSHSAPTNPYLSESPNDSKPNHVVAEPEI